VLSDHFINLTMKFLHPFFQIIEVVYCSEQWGHVSGLDHALGLMTSFVASRIINLKAFYSEKKSFFKVLHFFVISFKLELFSSPVGDKQLRC